MSGSEPARLLEWDSAFWGVTIGRVEEGVLDEARAGALDVWARERDVECVYFLARSDDAETVALVQQRGFGLVDVRVELERTVEPPEQEPGAREHRAEDVPALRAIARAAHEGTRFFADPSFPDERCRDLYETWIEESCRGWADVVLVHERNATAAGYVTCHLQNGGRDASIGLVGVAEAERGKGIGGELVRGALAWCFARGVMRLTVVTQGANVPALRLYGNNGFRIASVGLWFHKWYTP
jgi:dTDP-4-amino-4,6-dideoxy-D-galactose acyltransferase